MKWFEGPTAWLVSRREGPYETSEVLGVFVREEDANQARDALQSALPGHWEVSVISLDLFDGPVEVVQPFYAHGDNSVGGGGWREGWALRAVTNPGEPLVHRWLGAGGESYIATSFDEAAARAAATPK